jgi:hypothetical protein
MVFGSGRRRRPELLLATCLSLGLASLASAQAPCADVDYVGVTVVGGAVVLGTQVRSVFWDSGFERPLGGRNDQCSGAPAAGSAASTAAFGCAGPTVTCVPAIVVPRGDANQPRDR